MKCVLSFKAFPSDGKVTSLGSPSCKLMASTITVWYSIPCIIIEGVSFQKFYDHLIEWNNFGQSFGQLWGSSKTSWRQFWDNLEVTLYLCICMYVYALDLESCVWAEVWCVWQGQHGLGEVWCVWGGGGFLGHPGLLVWGEPAQLALMVKSSI